MSLPIVTLPGNECWDCHQCGICCRGSLVPLNAEDVERLRSQNWDQHPEFQKSGVMVRQSWWGDGYRLAQRADGSCVFLNEQGLCRIHSELGFAAKPTICRVFPLQLVPRDKSVAFTIRRACPSAAEDKGQAITGHLPLIQEFVREGRLSAEAIAPPLLKRGEAREWRTIHNVLAALARLLQDDRYPPVRRLAHATQFVELLERARTHALDHARLTELIQVLETACVEEAAPFFSERTQPSGTVRLLFRLLVLQYVKLHPRYRASSGWSERTRLATVAWRMMRGIGKLPKFHPEFPDVSFEQLEEPLGRIDPLLLKPLARFLETSAASYVYALAHRGQWSVIDSLRSLAMTLPVGMYLLKWGTAGRDVQLADVLDLIVALDRGQGFAPLYGWQNRTRLQMLARLRGLEPLLAWYAR